MLGQLVRQVYDIIALYVAHGDLCYRIQAASVSHVPELTCEHEKFDISIAIHCCRAISNYSNIAVKSPSSIILMSVMKYIESDVYFLTGVKKATNSGYAGYACIDRFRSLSDIDCITRFTG